jgi:ATP-dependent RNA helicase DeaD
MAMEEHEAQHELVKQIMEYGYSPYDIAAAAIQLTRQVERLPVLEEIRAPAERQGSGYDYSKTRQKNGKGKDPRRSYEKGMVRLSINLGKTEGIHPGHIVGAIANTSGIPGSAIGAIDIQRKTTFLDVNERYVGDVLQRMRNWKINNKPVQIQSV